MQEKSNSIAAELIAGFKDLADALERNEDVRAKFTCYQMQLDLEPTTYTPRLVKKTRSLLGASQAVFGAFLGVSVKTVSQWEQGLGTPSPMACRFMDEIRQNPKYFARRLANSLVRKKTRQKKLV